MYRSLLLGSQILIKGIIPISKKVDQGYVTQKILALVIPGQKTLQRIKAWSYA